MEVTSIILGFVLLLFGRKLYWLLVGVAGFLVGMEIGASVLTDKAEWIVLLVAIGCGLVGALLAVVLQRVAFALAGFLAGGYLAILLAQSLNVVADAPVFLVGGIIGAIVAYVAMERAIIALASLVGAGAVVEGLTLAQPLHAIVFVGLAIMGFVVQSRSVKKRGRTA